jgi:hypothetical protein
MIVSESDVFNLDISTLYALSTDFEKRLKWDYQTRAIGFLDGHSVLRQGAMVYTESIEGVRMDTEYIDFDPPNNLAIEMRNNSSIFTNFKGTWKFSEVSDTTTELKIIYQFELRFPFNLISLLVQKRIQKNMQNKLTFLSDSLKTMNLRS